MCTTDETRDNRPELLLLTSPCGKRKTKTTKTCVCVCVRSLTSTSWWSSDPRPAAGLVSAVFAWLRPECRRREPRGLKGAVEMKEDEGWRRRIWTGSLTPNAGCFTCCFVSTSSPPIHAAPFSKRLKKKQKERLCQTRHCTPWPPAKSMSSILRNLFICVCTYMSTVLWLHHGFCS